MNKNKLGLDIGTNSIGWAVLEKEDKKYKFFHKADLNGNLIPTKGSYIFPKGTEANEKSKAATRRGFRSARRRIDRIRRRKVATLKVLSENKMCPPLLDAELNDWRYSKKYPCNNEDFIEWQRTGRKGGDIETEKNKQPYYLRYIAATKGELMNSQYGRYQLGRAFYHLAQRRGYKSIDEEQTEDAIEQFKLAVRKLLEEYSNPVQFLEPFNAVAETYKNDKKIKSLTGKIKRQLKKETSFQLISDFIQQEFDKKENLGKVASGINELSEEIEKSGQPTLGCYFNSIYADTKDDGTTERIRGRYIDRDKHYIEEFNYICDKQQLEQDLRDNLHFALFYQRPLKSQKGLVAKCPFEPKRKRIAISHPLYEEFKMWESINRIKIRTESDPRLKPLNKDEKDLIKNDFEQIKDVEFYKLAEKLSRSKDFRYIKDREKESAEVEFNFPMTTTFSGSPTITRLQKVLGKDDKVEYRYNNFPLLNSGYRSEKNKKQLSIEDIWHCLFVDSFGTKDKIEARKDFAHKHLNGVDVNTFANIKFKKGYGNLSKAAIKKILPYLKKGYHYSHAVFMANIPKVLGRTPSEKEEKVILNCIEQALKAKDFEKSVNAVVNNYIDKYKNEESGFGDEPNSIWVHKNGIKNEIEEWFSEDELEAMTENEQKLLENKCWTKFETAVKDKRPKEVKYYSSSTIPELILEQLQSAKDLSVSEINIENLYHPSAMETYPKADEKLGNPEISSIKNPVFNKAMHQIKNLINKLIEEGLVNKDTEVNIEMAREINSASYRRALVQYQNDQKAIRNWARDKIKECYPEEKREDMNPTDDQIVKYILYAEQNQHCLYTGKTITPRKFFTEQKYDIEHTIPRSKTNDNSLVNKTLANADFNRNFKKDELPANLDLSYKGEKINGDTIIQNRDAWLKSYTISNNEIQFNVKLSSLKEELRKYKRAAKAAVSDAEAHDSLMDKVHYTRMKLNYLAQKYRTFEREDIPAKFTNANLVDTRLITKYARAYLNSYFKKVNVINGQITDTLRKIWGLQGQYEEKDRSNHIHHCIDAVTVACVEKGTVNRMSEAFHRYEREYFEGNESAKVYLPEPMNDFTGTMKRLKDEVFIYHKQVDRIKPMLDELKKEKPELSVLRGSLNSQNPYGIRKKENGKYFYVQRKSITKIKEKDIANIADKRIQERIQNLCDTTGKKIEKLVSENGDFLVLPEYEAPDKKGNWLKVVQW